MFYCCDGKARCFFGIKMPVVLQNFIENRNCSDGVSWSKEQCSFATVHGIVVDRSSRPYGTDIKNIDYGEVLEAFILSDQINKPR